MGQHSFGKLSYINKLMAGLCGMKLSLLTLQADTCKEQAIFLPIQEAHGSKTPRYPRQNGGMTFRTSWHSTADADPRWLWWCDWIALLFMVAAVKRGSLAACKPRKSGVPWGCPSAQNWDHRKQFEVLGSWQLDGVGSKVWGLEMKLNETL